MLEQSVPESLRPWKELTLVQLMKDCLPRVGCCAGAEEECREEGVAQTTSSELNAIPIPCSPVTPGGEGEKLRARLSPGKRDRLGEGVLKICSYFSLS